MWECKYCSYRLSDMEYLNAADDYPCPDCNAPLSSFEDVTSVEHSDLEEIIN